MAISDYLNSLSDYFESFDYFQDFEEVDESEFMLAQLDHDSLLN